MKNEMKAVPCSSCIVSGLALQQLPHSYIAFPKID